MPIEIISPESLSQAHALPGGLPVDDSEGMIYICHQGLCNNNIISMSFTMYTTSGNRYSWWALKGWEVGWGW